MLSTKTVYIIWLITFRSNKNNTVGKCLFKVNKTFATEAATGVFYKKVVL